MIDITEKRIKEKSEAKCKKKITSYANRGLKFESLIEEKCIELQKQNIALIHKVPTEWKVIRNKAKIINAYPVSESKFCDFIGIYKNKAIAIEAKETKETTRFPFANIKDTQWDFFNLWCNLNGKGYYLIRFTEHKKVFMVEAITFQECRDNIGRKSVPYDWFSDKNNAIEIDYIDLNFIDYIK